MILLALFAISTALGEPAELSALELATRLVDGKTHRLHDLEAVLGPLDRDVAGWEGLNAPLRRQRESGPVLAIEVSFDIDIYHQEPTQPNPPLGSWSLTLRAGREEIRELLVSRFGPPISVGYRERFGSVFFYPRGDEGCSLEWYRHEPEWAKATRSKAETAALQQDLVRFLSSGRLFRSTIEEIFGPLEPYPGRSCDRIVRSTWVLRACPAGAQRPTEIVVSFDHDRPLPATEALLKALGLNEPLARSVGVHMDSQELVEGASLERPRVAGLPVAIAVAREGLEATDREVPGSLLWRAPRPLLLSIRIGGSR